MAAGDARLLAERLGLEDDELCSVLGLEPLALIAGEGDIAVATPILLALTAEADGAIGPDALRRWARTRGRHGVPVDLLVGRDFERFEQAVEDLLERGFVIGG